MKTRQGRAKSPNSLLSSAKKILRQPSLQSAARKLTRSFSNASVTSSSRIGGSNVGEELFASWNGKTLIITGLQDHHWQHFENKSSTRKNEESEYVNNNMYPASPQPSDFASEADDTNIGHQSEAKNGNINGNKTRTGARRGRPRGRGRGRKKSRLKSTTTHEEMQSENEAYSPNKNYIKEFQQKAEDEAENLQRMKKGSGSPSKSLEQQADEQRATDTPALTPSPVEIDDTLTAEDLPSPYLSRASTPNSSAGLDAAALLMKERFLPLAPLSSFSDPLTRYAPAARTTATLYALAENAQRALVSWQTEYLKLDARTAPAAHPPKRPATGGRVPMDPTTWDAIKQSELYGYTLDPRREPSAQDPFTQRGWRRGGAFASAARVADPGPGRGSSRGRAGHSIRGNSHGRRISSQDGRELRLRQKRGYADSDEEEEEEEEEAEAEEQRDMEETYDINDEDYGSGPSKRGRRSTARFGNDTPDSKRGSAAPENEVRSEPVRKRGRPSTASILARQLEARGEASPSVTPQVPRRRGRPPGSKNSARRSDAGIKKGPRVKPGVSPATISRTATPIAIGSAAAAAESVNSINDRDLSTGRDSSVNTRLDTTKPLPNPSSLLTTLPSTKPDLNCPSTLIPSSIHADEAISPHNPTPNPYLESLHSAISTATTPIGFVNTNHPDANKKNLSNASSPAVSDRQVLSTASPSSPKRHEQQKQQQPKSEKRSASITKWWAQRKAKEAAVGSTFKASVASPVPEPRPSATTTTTNTNTATTTTSTESSHDAASQLHNDKNNVHSSTEASGTVINKNNNNNDMNRETGHAATPINNLATPTSKIEFKEANNDLDEEEEDSMLGADSDTDAMLDRSDNRRLADANANANAPTSAAYMAAGFGLDDNNNNNDNINENENGSGSAYSASVPQKTDTVPADGVT